MILFVIFCLLNTANYALLYCKNLTCFHSFKQYTKQNAKHISFLPFLTRTRPKLVLCLLHLLKYCIRLYEVPLSPLHSIQCRHCTISERLQKANLKYCNTQNIACQTVLSTKHHCMICENGRILRDTAVFWVEQFIGR